MAETTLTCQQCGQTYLSREDLDRHNRQMHMSGGTATGRPTGETGGVGSERVGSEGSMGRTETGIGRGTQGDVGRGTHGDVGRGTQGDIGRGTQGDIGKERR